MSDFEKLTMILVLVGWAFNLGILWQMSRSHGDKLDKHDAALTRINDRIDDHHESMNMHISDAWQKQLDSWHESVERQLSEIHKTCLDRASKGCL
jgi:hypothetical protein